MFSAGTAQFKASIWLQIDQETRSHIRSALLDNLVDRAQSDMQFMKDICTCICAIAVIEIPTNHWPDFITSMTSQGDQNENQFFKRAGLYNLGWVMEDLLPRDINNQEDLNRIWSTMLNNIDASNLDLTQIVAKSVGKLSHAS